MKKLIFILAAVALFTSCRTSKSKTSDNDGIKSVTEENVTPAPIHRPEAIDQTPVEAPKIDSISPIKERK